MANDGETPSINEFLNSWKLAVISKNVDALMQLYTPNVEVFNVMPPLQIDGAEAWRQAWEYGLSHFPDAFDILDRDIEVDISDNRATIHRLIRFPNIGPDTDENPVWMRATMCLKFEHGKWMIFHEHNSFPI